GDGGNDVRHQVALDHLGNELEVDERRTSDVHAIGAVAPRRDHVVAELSAGRLHRLVHLAGRDLEALGHDLEVIDESLHGLFHDVFHVTHGVADAVRTHLQLGGP